MFFSQTRKKFNEIPKLTNEIIDCYVNTFYEIPSLRCTEVSAILIVLGSISNEEHVMRPSYLKQGLIANSGTYIYILVIIVKPSIDSV